MTGDLDLAERRLAAGLKLYPDEPLIISLQGMLHARRNEAGPALECALAKRWSFPHSFRPYAPHLLSNRLHLCRTGRNGKGDGMAGTQRRHRQSLLAFLQGRSASREPASGAPVSTARRRPRARIHRPEDPALYRPSWHLRTRDRRRKGRRSTEPGLPSVECTCSTGRGDEWRQKRETKESRPPALPGRAGRQSEVAPCSASRFR